MALIKPQPKPVDTQEETKTYTKKEPKSIGALWSKTAKTGNEYLAGYIEIGGVRIKVTGFIYDHPEGSKRPKVRLIQ